MKKSWSIPLVLLAVLPVAHSDALAREASVHAEPSAAQAQAGTFRERFAQARKLGSYDEMGKLLQQHKDEAVRLVFDLCLQASRQTNEALEQEIEALRTAWKSTLKTDFVLLTYEYYSLLTPAERKDHYSLESRYARLEPRTTKAIEAKEVETLLALAGEWRDLALAFKQIGDMQYMALAGMQYYQCTNERNLGPRADLKRACEALGFIIEARETWKLEDSFYHQSKDAYSNLVGLGYGPDGTPRAQGGGAPGAAPASAPAAAAAPTAEGAPIEVALAFQAVEQIDQFDRPGYDLDASYPTWAAVYIDKTKKAELGSFPEGQRPILTRTASAEIAVDGNRDAQPDTTLKVTGNLSLMQFNVGTAAEQRPWACLWVTGTDKEMYQDMEVSLQPNDDGMTIFMAPAASMTGAVAGVPVRVFDDNMDGIYGSAPMEWGYKGIVDGFRQPNVDSIAIGNSKRARPWSELQQIGNAWYKLEPKQGGRALTATPTSVQTGTLKLEAKGPAPDRVIVKQLDHGNYYDLVEGGAKGVQVPAGRYQLYMGYIREGKRRDVTKALMLPGKAPITVDVAAGATAVMKLGAPYGFDFAFALDGDKLTVEGEKVAVIGSAGERYERTWNCRPVPEVSWRKAGSKKGEKPRKLDVITDSQEMYAQGWEYAYLPKRTVFDVDKNLGALELQLTQKKHALFGAIESVWKK